jgi:hypothetical protein
MKIESVKAHLLDDKHIAIDRAALAQYAPKDR